MSEKHIRVKLVRSPIGRLPKHRKTVTALGLGKLNSTREHTVTPAIMGMVKSVSYLLEVEELD